MHVPIALRRRALAAGVAVVGLAALLAALLATQLGGGPPGATAADHLDAPGLTSPGGDGRLDLNDIYAFQSPTNPNRTVLVMTVNPATPAGTAAFFARGVPGVARSRRVEYTFHIDQDGDAIADRTYAVRFGKVRNGVQPMQVRRDGRIIIAARTARTTRLDQATRVNRGGNVRAAAGVFDDPFFFDLNGFLNITAPLDADPANDADSFIGCDPAAGRPDFFAGLNVSAIVLEIPNRQLTGRGGDSNIGVWATTSRGGDQVDRMGRPAINTVFIPNNPLEPAGTEASMKDAFNAGQPADDQAAFRAEVVDTLTLLHSLNDVGGPVGGADDPSDDADKVNGLADVLLPDILTTDVSSAAGFLNGRGLADDVVDAELGLITEGLVTTDCVDANDVAFRNVFPYLAPAH